MADVRLTAQNGSTAGVTATRTALATADSYQVLLSPGGTWINWVKTGAGDATITIVTPNTVDGLAIADRDITVAATTGDVMAEFFPADYADSAGDLVFTTDDEASITAAVFQR